MAWPFKMEASLRQQLRPTEEGTRQNRLARLNGKHRNEELDLRRLDPSLWTGHDQVRSLTCLLAHSAPLVWYVYFLALVHLFAHSHLCSRARLFVCWLIPPVSVVMSCPCQNETCWFGILT